MASAARRRARRIEAARIGSCGQCFVRPVEPGARHCAVCAARGRERYRPRRENGQPTAKELARNARLAATRMTSHGRPITDRATDEDWYELESITE